MPDYTNSERLALYTHLRSFESDFDKSQSQIRSICSAWSAAVIAAIALITVNAFTPPASIATPEGVSVRAALELREAHLAYLRAIVCIIGSAGVFAFWFVDQRIYQRMIQSVFTHGLFMELKNPDLPQLRSSLYIANLDITNGLSMFYRMQFWLFLLIAAVFVAQPFEIDLGEVPKGIKALTWVHLVFVLLGEIFSHSWRSLNRIINDIYPELSAEMPERISETSRIDRLFRPEIFWDHTYRLPSPENERLWHAWVRRVHSSMHRPAPLALSPPADPPANAAVAGQ